MTEELLVWEQEQLDRTHERWEPTKKRRAFDPCDERLFKRRAPKWWRGRELPVNRKMWEKHVRTMNRNINEESLHPTKHHYHTGGWLSW